MKKESLYLDTSVPSAYYDERVKERKETTIIFWEEILPNYNACISEITTKEINDTKDLITKKKLLKLIKNFKLLKTNKKIIDLSNAYIENGIFPEKYSADAMHVSVATFHNIPYLVSWNF